MPEKKNYTFIIPLEHANERLDQALAKLLPDYSRTEIQQWIEAGSVLVNGNLSKGKVKVKGGENITVETIVKPPLKMVAQPIPLNIVYEDDEVLIINKPIGMVVHPGAGNADNTLLNALLHHCPGLQYLPRAGILHRLDKDTSGLLIIAKTAHALKHLSHQLKKRTLLREYQAIVTGRMISGGTVDAPICRHPLQRKRMAVVETGKKAVTHYRVAEKYRFYSRLKVRLETGRTHQIRVHLSHIRHPIVGDTTYGFRLQLKKHTTDELIKVLREFKHQALHAYIIGFTHPTTNEFMRFEIDLPEDMQQLVHALRNDLKQNEGK